MSNDTKRQRPESAGADPRQKKPRLTYDETCLPTVPRSSGTWDEASGLTKLINKYGATKLESPSTVDEIPHGQVQQYWGRAREFSLEHNVVATGVELGVQRPSVRPLIPSRIYIFREYRYLLERCAPFIESKDIAGLLILGTPGIGKSTLLYLWLFLAVLQSQPILSYHTGNLFLHCAAGVYIIPNLRAISDVAMVNMVLLLDFDAKSAGRDELLDVPTSLTIVAASSPNPDRYKDWTKQAETIRQLVLNPPDWDEVKRYYTSGCARFYTPDREKEEGFTLDHQIARGVYYEGFDFRELARYVMQGWEDAPVASVNTVRDAIQKITSKALMTLLDAVTEIGAPASHALIATYRGAIGKGGGDMMVHGPRSLFVYRALHARYIRADREALQMFRVRFRSFREYAATAGYAFEAKAHDLLTSKPMFAYTTSNQQTKQVFVVPHPATSIPCSAWNPKMEPRNLQHQVYYVPTSANNPTFDSFIIANGELYAFQMTVSPEPSVSDKGIELLEKCFEGPRTIIFVIPSDTETFTMPQPRPGFAFGVLRIQHLRSENPANEALDAVKRNTADVANADMLPDR
ncbi:SET domain-containing protein [Mycena kentingensis (nom. inval.)]|nr:SET domain-containing protein [Mycena kentingensis (nom. inval.)]